MDLCLNFLSAPDGLEEINILSDAAGHFRGFESLYNRLVLLPQKHKRTVCTHSGCEKHMKAEADELFGWMELALKRAKSLQCQKKNMQDLKWWVEDYSNDFPKRELHAYMWWWIPSRSHSMADVCLSSRMTSSSRAHIACPPPCRHRVDTTTMPVYATISSTPSGTSRPKT